GVREVGWGEAGREGLARVGPRRCPPPLPATGGPMPLLPVRLPPDAPAPPADIRRFLREAGRRIERFQRACHVPAFVASDFGRVYAALRFLEASGLLAG